jgi:hypothetical protein
MSQDAIQDMRDLLARAKPLCASNNPFVRVAGERIVTILLDTLVELDMTLVNPWDEVPALQQTAGAEKHR